MENIGDYFKSFQTRLQFQFTQNKWKTNTYNIVNNNINNNNNNMQYVKGF